MKRVPTNRTWICNCRVMNSVNLLKINYFSYTEAQLWVRVYTPLLSLIFPSSSFLCTLTLTDCSRLSHVLKSLAQYSNRKQSLTSHYARPFCSEVRRRDSLLNGYVLFTFFAKDNTRLTFENIYEQNTKYEIPLLDWYIFIYNKYHVTESFVFRPRKSTWENMWLKSLGTAIANRPSHPAPVVQLWYDSDLRELHYLPWV